MNVSTKDWKVLTFWTCKSKKLNDQLTFKITMIAEVTLHRVLDRLCQQTFLLPQISTQDWSALTFWTCKHIFQSLLTSSQLHYIVGKVLLTREICSVYGDFNLTYLLIHSVTCLPKSLLSSFVHTERFSGGFFHAKIFHFS